MHVHLIGLRWLQSGLLYWIYSQWYRDIYNYVHCMYT